MIVGLTGISGAGKHTAAEYLRRKGWYVADADTLAHALYRPYSGVWKALTGHFGEAIVKADDTIDRTRLAALVFDPEHPERLEALNAMVHPALRRQLLEAAHRHRHHAPGLLIVAALWKELGLRALCDKLLWIRTDPRTAYRRVARRDSLTEAAFLERVRHQEAPPDPDATVDNDGSLKDFYVALEKAVLL